MFAGLRLRIFVSSLDPFREIVSSMRASPAQTQVTSVGQRESSFTCLNVMRAPFPFRAAVLPTGSSNATPGSAGTVGSIVAHPRAAANAHAEINARVEIRAPSRMNSWATDARLARSAHAA
jgi:hypothetical protein